ncbi:MAG: hypothetical protein J2O47_00395, partial [Acidimicrobiaceae bacterium]|nr:hypothetical protein [Acidimicrobiaceae bacterium]
MTKAKALAALLGTAVLLLALAAPSLAAGPSRTHTAAFGTGDFTGSNPQGLAIDQASGDVYAVDLTNLLVRRYKPDGSPDNFTAGDDAGTNTLGATSPFLFGNGPTDTELAVDNSGGPADGALYVTVALNAKIEVYAQSGAHLGTLDGSGTPAGAFTDPCGVAVDQQSGDLYVADAGTNRIWRYSPSGATVSESDYSGGIDPGFSPCQLAADSGRLYAIDWGTSGGTGGTLARFKAASFALSPSTPTGITVDPSSRAVATDPGSGDVYADDGDHIAVYHQNGTPSYSFGSSTDFGANSAGIAVKPDGSAYVADRVAADPDGQRQIDVYGAEIFNVHNLTTTKAGLGAGTITSSPAGINCGPTCTSAFAEGTAVTLTAAPDPGSAFNSWSGCDAVAANQCTITLDADATVTATFSSAPALSGEAADQITAADARLSGNVNPGGESTTFHFDYLTDGDFVANGSSFSGPNAPVSTPESSPIGDDSAPHLVSRIVTGLSPGTTYHFRVVATNSHGTTTGADHTFATPAQPPPVDPCPNDALRQGPGASLPDCRAYEQASPTDKNGSDIQSDLNAVQAADDGSGITFWTLAGIPGAVGAQAKYPSYLATRGPSAWQTAGIVPPASLGGNALIYGWTPDLSQTFGSVGESGTPGIASFLARQSSDGTEAVIHPATTGLDSVVGASADGSKVYFEHRGVLAAGGAPGVNNLYLWNRPTGAVSLVGVLPDSACATPPCVPAAGTPFNAPADVSVPFPAAYRFERHYVSKDGERVYFNDGGDGQLYLRAGAAGPSPSTLHVSASQATTLDPLGPQPATFQWATPDGSKALFTSSEKLTDDANTGPPPNTAPIAIGRADLPNGDNVDDNLIPQSASDVKVDGSHVYWADPSTGAIGRADITDAACSPNPAPCNVNPNFIAGLG